MIRRTLLTNPHHDNNETDSLRHEEHPYSPSPKLRMSSRAASSLLAGCFQDLTIKKKRSRQTNINIIDSVPFPRKAAGGRWGRVASELLKKIVECARTAAASQTGTMQAKRYHLVGYLLGSRKCSCTDRWPRTSNYSHFEALLTHLCFPSLSTIPLPYASIFTAVLPSTIIACRERPLLHFLPSGVDSAP